MSMIKALLKLEDGNKRMNKVANIQLDDDL